MAQSQERRQLVVSPAVWRVVALVPLLLGFVLRLRYALGSEPFVDEPTTLLVARAIAASGLPVLPSGLFYGNDLPFSYLAGGLVALFGPHLALLRALSLVASVATIWLVYQAGKRWFSPWAGLWAALLLALNPEAILWGGRARSYALLGLLVFSAVWLFYLGLNQGRNGARRLGLFLLVVAAFVHPEAALLLPAFAVAACLLAGWRWWLRPDRLLELVLAGLGLGARYWLQLALARGQIGGLATVAGSRPPLQVAGDWWLRVQSVAPFFLAPQQLPWTILALLALAVAVRAAARRRSAGRTRAILFLSACLWLVPLVMVVLLGSTYQSPRYLSMLLPVFALLAAAGLDALRVWADDLRELGDLRGILPVLALVALLAAYLPGAIEAANTREKGFRSALEYVGEHWQPGDRLATVAPAYSQWVLGRSDFFTLGQDYEEFAYRAADGRLLDRWLGTPLVRSAAELTGLLDGGSRLWFVTDESRLRQRFDPDFAQTVWQRMELVANTDGVMVFVSRPLSAPAVFQPVGATFGDMIALAAYDLGLEDQRGPGQGWGEVVVVPGATLPLTLYWQAVAPVTGEYTVFVHLLGADGERWAQDDAPPLGGLQPMTHWQAGEVLPDRRRLELPADLPPGRYRLDVGLYGWGGDGDRLTVVSATGQELGQVLPLDFVQVSGPSGALPSPEQPLSVGFGGNGDRIRLLGYTLADAAAAPGDRLALVLYWQAPVPPGTDYTVFVHLLDEEGQIRGQGDGPPAGGFYPTSHWDPGEIVVDSRQVAVDAGAPPGTYRLVVGLYVLSTDRRLLTEEGDQVLIDEVQIR